MCMVRKDFNLFIIAHIPSTTSLIKQPTGTHAHDTQRSGRRACCPCARIARISASLSAARVVCFRAGEAQTLAPLHTKAPTASISILYLLHEHPRLTHHAHTCRCGQDRVDETDYAIPCSGEQRAQHDLRANSRSEPSPRVLWQRQDHPQPQQQVSWRRRIYICVRVATYLALLLSALTHAAALASTRNCTTARPGTSRAAASSSTCWRRAASSASRRTRCPGAGSVYVCLSV
jgi:hypothetical protein